MMGVEYSNRGVEEKSASSTGILKRHDILINIITSQKMYEQTIYRGANILHGMIGMMSFCNTGIVSLRVDLFI